MTEKVSSEKDIDKTKKTRKTKKKVEEFQNEDEVLVEPVEEPKNEKSELELLREQIRLLQEANEAARLENERLLKLSAKVLDSAADVNGTSKTVMVKCLELNGVELSSPNGDTTISLPYDTWVDCDVNELNQIFKKVSNRTLFEDGICIMEDGALEQFRIKAKVVVDMDKIAQLLDEGVESKIIKELDRLTNNKRKSSVSHLILYAIVGKMLDGELDRIPRSATESLETYFGVKLKNVETLLKIFRQIKE